MRLPEPVWTKLIFSVLETHEDLMSSTCPLCRFFGSLRSPGRVPESGSLNLRCICSLLEGQENSRTHGKEIDHSPIFTLRRYDNEECDWIDEGIFGVLHPWSRFDNFAPRSLEPQSIDFAILREWLHICELSHHDCCEETQKGFAHPFRVLDCQTKSVVQVPHKGCRYASLSYVWPADEGDMSNIAYPQAIMDAFVVCLQTNIRYIWVDRYVTYHE